MRNTQDNQGDFMFIKQLTKMLSILTLFVSMMALPLPIGSGFAHADHDYSYYHYDYHSHCYGDDCNLDSDDVAVLVGCGRCIRLLVVDRQ